jgi:hypothetical protein
MTEGIRREPYPEKRWRSEKSWVDRGKFLGVTNYLELTRESIIDQTPFSQNPPQTLFAKEGVFLPLEKGGKEGFYKEFFDLRLINMSIL